MVGAGIGGLAAAIALSRLGCAVEVVERDDTPMPDDVEGAFAWDRRGAPQVRHTHGFPALIRVHPPRPVPRRAGRRCVDAGVGEVSIMPPSVPPDAPDYERDAEDLQVLSCRRTTLEWVLRRCALAEPACVPGRCRRGRAPVRPTAAPATARRAGRAARRRDRAARPTSSSPAPAGGAPCRPGSPRTASRCPRRSTRPARSTCRASTGAPTATTCRWATRAAAGPGSASSSPAPTTAPTRPRSPSPPTTASCGPTSSTRDRFEAVLPLFREMEPVVAPRRHADHAGAGDGRADQPHPPLRRRRRRAARPRLLRHRRRAHVHEPALRPRVVARRAPGGARGRRRWPRTPTTATPRPAPTRRRAPSQGRALVRRVGH